MNKNELIARVAEDAKLSKGEAGEAVEATLENISKALQQGEEVRIVGFGTFMVSKRKASSGRDPRTGEPIQIAESKNPKFKAGKGLKDAVNNAANNN
jgi:DNA-binding protein HU-beta